MLGIEVFACLLGRRKKMPLGVANDWRVERSLVGTWKSSVTPSRLSEPRKKAQKPPCKDFEPKKPTPSPFGSRPLTFRFLTALFCAL